ncbi:MAG: imidazole glycerol phosphate synthase cyclase subunit [Sediminibacterium sp.]|nr:imidazole glycerol phosphate synthase cyclase subunit [Sediminibacterium sp.]
MLKVRIIPILLLKDGRMVKGKQFTDYRDTGDPVFASRIYNVQFVDELIFLDITATNEGRETYFDIIEQVSKECFMPLTIGGGISNVSQIRKLLKAGADKVVINTAAVNTPQFIEEAAAVFGSQCIVVGIDVRYEEGNYIVYTNSGKLKTDLVLADHIVNMERLGAGEIFINSIDRDGMMQGYDHELIKLVLTYTTLPVIGCGGAGNFMHLVDAYKNTGIGALAMASIYHFGDNNPVRARSYLKNQDINIKTV